MEAIFPGTPLLRVALCIDPVLLTAASSSVGLELGELPYRPLEDLALRRVLGVDEEVGNLSASVGRCWNMYRVLCWAGKKPDASSHDIAHKRSQSNPKDTCPPTEYNMSGDAGVQGYDGRRCLATIIVGVLARMRSTRRDGAMGGGESIPSDCRPVESCRQ